MSDKPSRSALSEDRTILANEGTFTGWMRTRSNLNDYIQPLAAVGALFPIEIVLASARLRFKRFVQAIDNNHYC